MMTDDHIKRFNLSQNSPARAFGQSAGGDPRVKTKDNAQPVIPPPRTIFLPHPRLAPPGMMGARPTFALTPKPKDEGRFNTDDLYFKPFAHRRDKSPALER